MICPTKRRRGKFPRRLFACNRGWQTDAQQKCILTCHSEPVRRLAWESVLIDFIKGDRIATSLRSALLRCPKFCCGIGPRCAIRPVGTFVPAERGTALKTACYICHWQRCAVFPAVSATGSARIAPHIAPHGRTQSVFRRWYQRQRRRSRDDSMTKRKRKTCANVWYAVTILHSV